MTTKEPWLAAVRRLTHWGTEPEWQSSYVDPLVARMYHAAKARARIKGLPFTITHDDIVIPDYCPALGTPLVWNGGTLGIDSISLDRIQPQLGYVPGNVAVISALANTLKGNKSIDQVCARAAAGLGARPIELRAVAAWLCKVHPDGWMYGPR